MPIPQDYEVVEDSEPEREDRRQKRKAKQAKRSEAPPATETYYSRVTEFNRTRSASPNRARICEGSASVYSTSTPLPSIVDFSSPSVQKSGRCHGFLTSGAPSREDSTRSHDSSHRPPVHSTPAEAIPGLSDSPELASGGLNLHKFAHKPVIRSSKSAPPAAQAAQPFLSRPLAGPISNSEPAERSKCRPLAQWDPYEFTPADYAILLKCVSCDAAWTIKKTASQKLRHIQSCSKKKGYTEETIRILVRKNLENARLDAKMKGKGTSADLHNEGLAPPTSLLDQVINETFPKRKGARPAAAETVKSIVETRDRILERAKTIFGHSVPLTSDHSEPNATQAFGQSNFQTVDHTKEPPSTQGFSRSNLAEDYGSRLDIPTLRQPFLIASGSTIERNGHQSRDLHSKDPEFTQTPGFSLTDDVKLSVFQDNFLTSPKRSPIPLAGSGWVNRQSSFTKPRASPEVQEDRKMRILQRIMDSQEASQETTFEQTN